MLFLLSCASELVAPARALVVIGCRCGVSVNVELVAPSVPSTATFVV